MSFLEYPWANDFQGGCQQNLSLNLIKIRGLPIFWKGPPIGYIEVRKILARIVCLRIGSAWPTTLGDTFESNDVKVFGAKIFLENFFWDIFGQIFPSVDKFVTQHLNRALIIPIRVYRDDYSFERVKFVIVFIILIFLGVGIVNHHVQAFSP